MNIAEIIAIVIIAVVGIASIIVRVVQFTKKNKSEKINSLREWLKWAVAEAEKYFGSGTGQLKLRYVYDMALSRFPIVIGWISFDIFASWVDDALSWLNDQLNENDKIEQYVECDKS